MCARSGILNKHEGQQQCESREWESGEKGSLWAEGTRAEAAAPGDEAWKSIIPPSLRPVPRLTHNGEVDLGLPAAQPVLHQQSVAATVLLACSPDGELADVLTVLHLDVLTLLDLGQRVGQALETLSQKGRGLRPTLLTPGDVDTAAQAVWGWSCLGSELPPKRGRPPKV